jgi:hypothetical protein
MKYRAVEQSYPKLLFVSSVSEGKERKDDLGMSTAGNERGKLPRPPKDANLHGDPH